MTSFTDRRPREPQTPVQVSPRDVQVATGLGQQEALSGPDDGGELATWGAGEGPVAPSRAERG